VAAVRLDVGGLAPEQAVFGCSAAHEALRGLGVLAAVRHHPLHVSWALDARARMPPALRTELEAYAYWFARRPMLFPRIWPLGAVAEWDEEIAALRTAPIAHFTEPFLHVALMDEAPRPPGPPSPAEDPADPATRRARHRPPLHTQPPHPPPMDALQDHVRDFRTLDAAVARAAAHHPASAEVLRGLIDDPEAARRRFTAFLTAYWDACVAPDWPELRRALHADLARRGRAASLRGLPRMLAGLSPLVRADPASGEVHIRPQGRPRHRPGRTTVLTGGDRLILTPSHFVWPELSTILLVDGSGGRERRTVLIVYALPEMEREGRAPIPPEDLLALLRAAADPTRMQILQLLARRARSTREIAGLIGLTEAAVSKHLRILQDARWTMTERRSYYVYYRLARGSLTDLTTSLTDLLGRAPRSPSPDERGAAPDEPDAALVRRSGEPAEPSGGR
jgi:DNA-binding transcriptional ArsR family regulator